MRQYDEYSREILTVHEDAWAGQRLCRDRRARALSFIPLRSRARSNGVFDETRNPSLQLSLE